MEKKNKKNAEFNVRKDGPIQVSGDFILKSAEGKVIETEDPIFLCRCGNSKNKPFCDGSHRRVGFKD